MEKTFELKAIELATAVDCKYIASETSDDNITSENEYHVKVARPIHLDLRDLFEKDLTRIVCAVLNVTEDYPVIPTGVSFAGKNDNVGIRISGTIATAFGYVKFKTPRIKYKTGETKVDAELTIWVDKLISEVYAFLFDNKMAEMEVFGE